MNENLGNIVPNDNSKKNKKTVKKDSSWLKEDQPPASLGLPYFREER